MKVIFSLLFFIFSTLFTIKGFDYNYMSGTQVGPGFFPRWTGFLLILFTGYNLYREYKEYRQEKESEDGTVYVKELILIIILTGLFILSLKIIGTLIAMILYFFLILFLLNREQLFKNVISSIIIPICVYLLLNVWLQAGFPKGIFELF